MLQRSSLLYNEAIVASDHRMAFVVFTPPAPTGLLYREQSKTVTPLLCVLCHVQWLLIWFFFSDARRCLQCAFVYITLAVLIIWPIFTRNVGQINVWHWTYPGRLVCEPVASSQLGQPRPLSYSPTKQSTRIGRGHKGTAGEGEGRWGRRGVGGERQAQAQRVWDGNTHDTALVLTVCLQTLKTFRWYTQHITP